MSKKTMALAAVLLACGIGAASAQGQGEGQAQGQRPGQATPPFRQQVPDAVPLQPHVDKPKVNPSAAGTLTEREGGASQRKANEDTREHSGSVGSNANTHPLKSLEAGGEPREQGMTAPSGIQPPPSSTMNRDAGR
ncbi:MAG TPA: hypothetical protein VHG31_02550 [Stellaceae bacterium]|nr:hypothetical protein [Stellaceae bacterium]